MLLTRLSEALTGSGARKVVIFSQFVQLLKRVKPLIQKEFPEVALLELTGHTKNRAKPVEAFQKTDGPAVILVSLKAGGTGITLVGLPTDIGKAHSDDTAVNDAPVETDSREDIRRRCQVEGQSGLVYDPMTGGFRGFDDDENR